MNKYDMRLIKFAILLRRSALFKIIFKNIQEIHFYLQKVSNTECMTYFVQN